MKKLPRRARMMLLGLCVTTTTAATSLLVAQDAAPANDPSGPAAPQTEGTGLVQATDKAALEAAKGKTITVEGKVSLAEWSKTGKVLNIEFADAPHFVSAAFERQKAKFDEGFNGDVAKTLTGAVVRITGKVEPYGGHTEKYKGTLQVVMTGTHQLTIITPAATQPAP